MSYLMIKLRLFKGRKEMKSTNFSFKRKVAVIFTVLSLLFVYVVPVDVSAKPKTIEPYALVETYS